jgi:drug/metabolite transporter (DMT)-like permease
MGARARLAGLSGPVQGGLWMTAAAVVFTVMTTLIRDLAGEIHPFQIAFVRAVVNLALMVPFVMREGTAAFRTDNHKVFAFRGLVGFIFLMSFFNGAALIPVDQSQALIFTAPLFTTILAALFLGEVLHLRRLSALVVGFAGAMIILRPGLQDISLGGMLVLIAAFAYGTSHALVKFTTRSDHPDKVVLFLCLYVVPLTFLPALVVWTWPSLYQLGMMIAIGVLATLNQRFLGRAFAAADAMAVLPFDFARLPVAALIGYLVFADLPDLWVWVGGVLIFTASVYIARRESRAARRAGA